MAVNRERKMKSVEQTELDCDGYTLGELSGLVEKLTEQYGADARIESCTRQYSDGTYLGIFTVRPETDDEMADRIVKEEGWDADRKSHERREFERLKAQFEPK
jgi:hypothetical protein